MNREAFIPMFTIPTISKRIDQLTVTEVGYPQSPCCLGKHLFETVQTTTGGGLVGFLNQDQFEVNK